MTFEYGDSCKLTLLLCSHDNDVIPTRRPTIVTAVSRTYEDGAVVSVEAGLTGTEAALVAREGQTGTVTGAPRLSYSQHTYNIMLTHEQTPTNPANLVSCAVKQSCANVQLKFGKIFLNDNLTSRLVI